MPCFLLTSINRPDSFCTQGHPEKKEDINSILKADRLSCKETGFELQGDSDQITTYQLSKMKT